MREEDLQKLNDLVSNDSLVEIETNITNIVEDIQPPVISEEPLFFVESATDERGKTISITDEYEKELYDDLIALAELQAKVDEKKSYIKSFIEDNKWGSFKTNLLKITYTSATTTTSIDTKAFKADLPELAAKYSKTSARSSSIKVEPVAKKTK